MRFKSAAAASTAAVLAASIAPLPGAQAASPSPTSPPAPPAVITGPHSPAGRTLAATKITRTDGVVVRDVDLGDVDLGPKNNPKGVRGPVRGVIVTPDKPAAHAPLVVINHLRMPGCEGLLGVFPCPKGRPEVRYDRGMTYLAQALAKRGYVVMIPDLAPLYIGRYMNEGYDQTAGWLKTVGMMRDTLMAANDGKTTRLGEGLKGAVDGRRTGLMVHSRSAYLVNAATAAWAHSRTPIGSVVAYGGAYDAPGDDGSFTPPPPANVPFLGLVSDSDADVDMMGSLWAGEHVGATRTAPWVEAVVHGYGHAYINRTLSAAKQDDRPDATGLPDAAAHEKLMTSSVTSWFDQTLRRTGKAFPMTVKDPVPTNIAGVPVRAFVSTNAPHTGYLAGSKGKMTAFGGGKVTVCRTYEDMDPGQHPDRCEMPDLGVVMSRSLAARSVLTATGGVRFTTSQKGTTELAIHLAPTGGEKDAKGSPLRVTVRLAGGGSYSVDVPRTHPALRETTTPQINGIYTFSTIRLPMPAKVTSGRIDAVELTAGKGTSHVDVRAVDLVAPHPAAARSTTRKPVEQTTGTTFLVETAPGDAGTTTARNAIVANGGTVVTAWPQIGVTVGVAPDARAASVVTALRSTRGIQAAGLSGRRLNPAPMMPRRTTGFTRPAEKPGPIAVAAKAVAANKITTGRGITIGIADNGVLDETPEFRDRFDATRSGSCVGGAWTPGNNAWRPSTSTPSPAHGTKVASVAAAGVNGFGLRGIAPDATIVAVRVGDDEGNMYPEASICAAMTGAAQHLPVLNHSYGVDSVTTLLHNLWDPARKDQAVAIDAVGRAFTYSRSQGVLNVAATGNSGEDLSDKPTVPLPSSDGNARLNPRMKALLAEVPDVVGVGEYETDGRVTFESTVGFDIADLSAVGEGQLPDGKGGYISDAGTSFSSPAVAGAAALVKAVRPNATPADIERILETTAVRATCANAGELVSHQPCRSNKGLTNFFGHGYLDALAVVRAAQR